MQTEARPNARTAAMAQTRARILSAALEMLPDAASVPVDSIAERAGVSVQTLYTHFGSKRGLLLAVIDTVQQDAGLYADIELVWQSPDGETALRRMIETTIGIWDRAWTIVEFAERARRADPEILRYLREVDGYRRSNLVSITERLDVEKRLRRGLDAQAAAEAAFALSVPSVYEELVKVRSWPLDRAAAFAADAVTAAIVDPLTGPVVDPPADWSSALRAAAVMERGSRA
jgi:AcrR family transcriptional regulator